MADNPFLDPIADLTEIADKFISAAGQSLNAERYVQAYRAHLVRAGLQGADIDTVLHRLKEQLLREIASGNLDNKQSVKFVFGEAIGAIGKV